MEEQIKEKRVADSLTEQFHEIRPEHLNGADVMFGGILMEIGRASCRERV